ncbi:hypothetical protein C8Q75DRAFT_731284 [Abortiporus biennis]|nr:hypothetical protein C8Q75DRAFT_731284 [Abortiporus biennis]
MSSAGNVHPEYKQQLSGHSDKCYSRFSHDGIVHLKEKPYNAIEKVEISKKIDIEHFHRVLAAFRFFHIHPPLEFLGESNSLEEKYIKPVLWFREHFLLPPFPSPRQVKYNIQEIPENFECCWLEWVALNNQREEDEDEEDEEEIEKSLIARDKSAQQYHKFDHSLPED